MEPSVLKGKRFAFISHLDFNLYRFRLPIMEALHEEGAEIWALVPPGPWAERFVNHGVRFLPWKVERRGLSPVDALKAIRSLRQLLYQVEPDVVHSFTQRPNLYTGLVYQWSVSGRWIASVTGLGSLYLEKDWRWFLARHTIENLQRWVFAFATAVIFQNQDDLRYYLQKKLCNKDQVHLIRGSGIDPRAFSPERVSVAECRHLRKIWGIPENAFVVLMIARLVRSKGVNEFLRAARFLVEEISDIYFVLIGDLDPGNPSSLTDEDLARAREIPHLILPGFQERVEPWLKIADLYVLPSYSEGLPRTVLEAMAMGLPVVTTDVPGCREVVDSGENGFLIPPGDAKALRDRILWFVRHPAERQRMGLASRHKVQREFSLDRVVEQHLALYQQVVSS